MFGAGGEGVKIPFKYMKKPTEHSHGVVRHLTFQKCLEIYNQHRISCNLSD